MIAAGDRLRDLREDKGKTQAEISSLLGTTQQIYSRYETNRTDLPLRHLIKLADYYQVTSASTDADARIDRRGCSSFCLEDTFCMVSM